MAWLTPKIDWDSKDYYNAEDLNRVENNTVEVANLLNQLINTKITLEPIVNNRNYSSIEFADSLNRVERNLEKVSSVFKLEGLKPLKTSWIAGDPFDYNDANRYENNLNILYMMSTLNIANTLYCGTFNCGEDVI